MQMMFPYGLKNQLLISQLLIVETHSLIQIWSTVAEYEPVVMNPRLVSIYDNREYQISMSVDRFFCLWNNFSSSNKGATKVVFYQELEKCVSHYEKFRPKGAIPTELMNWIKKVFFIKVERFASLSFDVTLNNYCSIS